MSQIHCIMLTKNEADVIACCLQAALKWADFIYIYDNYSTDGTWEILQSLQSERIIPWKQHNQNYSDALGNIQGHIPHSFARFREGLRGVRR